MTAKNWQNRLLGLLALLLGPGILTIHGQDRVWLKDYIAQQKQCRTVAITRTGGDLMIFGRNSWAGQRIPEDMKTALNKVGKAEGFINDVQISEKGHWLILWNNENVEAQGIPADLKSKLELYDSRGTHIVSVTFNDSDEWILVSQNGIESSDKTYIEWLEKYGDEFGELKTVSLTDDAVVAVFEKATLLDGNYPDAVYEKLSGITELRPYSVKIAGNAWFIANQDGSKFTYFM